jgi:hypothetical protein
MRHGRWAMLPEEAWSVAASNLMSDGSLRWCWWTKRHRGMERERHEVYLVLLSCNQGRARGGELDVVFFGRDGSCARIRLGGEWLGVGSRTTRDAAIVPMMGAASQWPRQPTQPYSRPRGRERRVQGG